MSKYLDELDRKDAMHITYRNNTLMLFWNQGECS